ncbi:MAG: hypothetical protein CMN77_00915 [Spirochaetaceae bacterium]|nr:hypothetical protein [Spirochaetaceae bacterium]|tara:strand:- start:19170 stop:20282 length:1113 start_codon:yes stop_codon:yes gene_type:complete
MRTYGVHGGEQQLSQLFGANKNPTFKECFCFVFKDSSCEGLFSQRAPELETRVLTQREQKTGTAWPELYQLLPRLPILQFRLWRLLRGSNFDACIVHGFQAALVAWPLAFFMRNLPFVYVHRATKESTRWDSVFRVLYRPFKFVAGNSDAVMQSLAKYTQSEKLLTLNNGIDLHRFDERSKQRTEGLEAEVGGMTLIAVGRLIPHKGQSLLIQSMIKLAAEYPRLSLWIVGDGVERQNLSRLIKEARLHSRVILLGQRSDVPSLLNSAHIFVNASDREGMSNAVLEGMAASLPSVVADAPGVSECHISGVTGLVVDRTPDGLVKGIRALLEDKKMAREMGRAARTRVEEMYSIEANRNAFYELYKRLQEN